MINNDNQDLILYRLCKYDEAQKPNLIPPRPIDHNELKRQTHFLESGLLEHRADSPDLCKLSNEGSQVLLNIYVHYKDNLKEILTQNRNIFRGSVRKIKINDIIQGLELNDLEEILAVNWVDYFIRKLSCDKIITEEVHPHSDYLSEVLYRITET